jgi:hypothetical protein
MRKHVLSTKSEHIVKIKTVEYNLHMLENDDSNILGETILGSPFSLLSYLPLNLLDYVFFFLFIVDH